MTIADTFRPANQVADAQSTPDKRLIRAGLLMLLFMTTAFGAATWNTMHDLAGQMKAVPVVLFVVVCILVARLYAKVDEIAAVWNTTARVAEHALAPNLGVSEHSLEPLEITQLAQIPVGMRNEIWNYWDKNGTSKQKIEYVSGVYGLPSNVVQHLIERYDVRWREQVAMLYCDNPLNEYTAHIGVDENQIREDSLRLKSGLPIYPIAGTWLCSDCRKRPCHCNLVTLKDQPVY
jgi:hypothetical protein